eukprot:766726_1
MTSFSEDACAYGSRTALSSISFESICFSVYDIGSCIITTYSLNESMISTLDLQLCECPGVPRARSTDTAATIAELTTGTVPQDIDGLSLVPVLFGNE